MVAPRLSGIKKPQPQDPPGGITRLGTILGIRIGLDYSWFVIFALLTWTLAGSYYPGLQVAKQ